MEKKSKKREGRAADFNGEGSLVLARRRQVHVTGGRRPTHSLRTTVLMQGLESLYFLFYIMGETHHLESLTHTKKMDSGILLSHRTLQKTKYFYFSGKSGGTFS